MNQITLLGRLTKDVELGTAGNTEMAKFTIAVNRNFKNKQGEYEADFIRCIAWGKTASTIEQYFKKGSRILLTGRMQTGSYDDKDGKKVYTTDVIVNNFEFVDTKADKQANNQQKTQDVANFWEEQGTAVDDISGSLPF